MEDKYPLDTQYKLVERLNSNSRDKVMMWLFAYHYNAVSDIKIVVK